MEQGGQRGALSDAASHDGGAESGKESCRHFDRVVDSNGSFERVHGDIGLFAIQDEQRAAQIANSERIWSSYLFGQLSNVAKAAVWWSMFGTLVISLLENNNTVAFTRAAFNAALVIVSPLAGAVSEHANIKMLLTFTTLARMLIWSVGVPAAWILFMVQLDRHDFFTWALIVLMFLDGVQVGFANVVDIDCGGLDTLSSQYNLPINDTLRSKFNGLHQMVFDLSFIFFTPPVALLLWVADEEISLPEFIREYLRGKESSLPLLVGMGIVFLILSTISLWFYIRGLPKYHGVQRSGAPGNGSGSQLVADSLDSDDSVTDISADEVPSLLQETKLRLVDVKDGFFVVIREKELGWRLVFLALETALEDSMVSVIIPLIALRSPELFAGPGENACANVWATAIVATGKLGGCFAGMYMNSRWIPPTSFTRNSAYHGLFWCVLASSASLLLLPASYYMLQHGMPVWMGGASVFLSAFFFFIFSTAPKIGFATLLQGLISSQEVACKVFGFVGAFVTIVDALVIAIVNVLFSTLLKQDILSAVSAVAILYLAHGLLEAVLGPWLILEPSASGGLTAEGDPVIDHRGADLGEFLHRGGGGDANASVGCTGNATISSVSSTACTSS